MLMTMSVVQRVSISLIKIAGIYSQYKMILREENSNATKNSLNHKKKFKSRSFRYGYRLRKENWRFEFKSGTRLFAFHITLYIWKRLEFKNSSRSAMGKLAFLKLWYGNRFRRRKTSLEN